MNNTESCRGDRLSPSGKIAITDIVAAVTRSHAILLQKCVRPSWSKHYQEWIRPQDIFTSDPDLDKIQVGDKITIEIPLWLAREKGLAE